MFLDKYKYERRKLKIIILLNTANICKNKKCIKNYLLRNSLLELDFIKDYFLIQTQITGLQL